MSFRVGGKVVYPAHGIAYIRGIKRMEVSGVSVDFYILHVVESDVRVMVPVKATQGCMRHVIDAYEADKVFTILKKPNMIAQRAWNRRFREFSEKLGAISIIEVAEVLRDLWILKMQKDLSFGENLMFERAIKLIKQEVGISTDVEPEVVEQKIMNCLEIANKNYEKMYL